MYDHHRDWDRYLDVNNFWVVSKDDDQGGSSVTALPLLLTVAIALHVLCRSLPLSSPSPFFCERPLYGCCTVPQSQEDPKILKRGPYMAAETALKIARPAINVCSRLIHFFTIISFTRLDIWNFQDLIFDIWYFQDWRGKAWERGWELVCSTICLPSAGFNFQI